MLPSQLKYGSKIESASAKSYKTNIAPQNGTSYTFGNGSSNIIYVNIPTGNNLLMATSENYLRFDLTYKNASGADSAFRWDACGAHGIIQRIRVFSGSNLIEDIDTYGNLAKMLITTQLNCPSNKTKWNILAGTRADYTGYLPANAYAQYSTIPVLNVQSGEMLTTANTPQYTPNNNIIIPRVGVIATGASSVTRTYCLNLISIVGSLCQNKYFPLFACGSAPLRVEIWLQDQISKCAYVTSDTGSTIQLDNVEFVASMIELNDMGMEIIRQSLGGNPLQFVVPSYRNYQFVNPAVANNGSLNINVPIPAKFSSLKALYCSIRDKLNTPTFFPFSSVTGGTFLNYSFRIGSLILPPKFPYSIAECYAELAKAMSSISDINYLANVDMPYYGLSASIAPGDTTLGCTQTGSGCFYIALDCENYPNASKSDIFAGMNTNASDIYLNYVGTNSTGGAITLRFDAYALFDQLLIFENSTCYVKF